MVLFNEVKKTFKKHGCILLMTEEEFNLTPRKVSENYKYTAQCGHNHEVWFERFKNHESGLTCPDCVHKKDSINKIEQYKLNPILPSDLEHDCIEYLITIIGIHSMLNLMANVVCPIVVLNLNILQKING
jgi:hypothetical protein